MGTTITKTALSNKEFFEREFNGEAGRVIDSSVTGNVYYAAYQSSKTGEVYGLVVSFSRKGNVISYKDMEETMMPYYFDCPIRILNKLSPTENTYANQWRQSCLDRAQQKSSANAKASRLQQGSTVQFTPALSFGPYGTEDTFLVEKIGSKIRFRMKKTGTLCRITNWKNRDFQIL